MLCGGILYMNQLIVVIKAQIVNSNKIINIVTFTVWADEM